MAFNRLFPVLRMLACTFLVLPLWCQTQNAIGVTCQSQASPGSSAVCAVSLSLANGAVADSFEFGVTVTPNGSAPALGAQMIFIAAVSPAPQVNNFALNHIGVLGGTFSPALSGTVVLGGIAFTMPSSAGAGQSYSVAFSGVSAAHGNTPIGLAAGPAATVGVTTLTSIAVTPANPTIVKGGTQQFTATGTYSDSSTANITSSVTWASASPSVATINTSGLATGLSAGTSNIIAFQGNTVSSTDVLTVTGPTLQSIAVSPTSPSIAKSATQQFTATGIYSDSSTANLTSTATWASSSTSVATISPGGLATGVAGGTTRITATVGNIVSPSDTLTVTVPVTLVAIGVTPAIATVTTKGGTQQFTATGTYSDASSANITSSVNWSSATTSVATISAAGLATAVANGSSNITANLGGVTSAAAVLTVSLATTLQSIAVTPVNPTVNKGGTQQFTATGTYSDSTTAPLTTVTWVSSNTAIATISASGLATAVASGSSNITASLGNVTSPPVLLTVPVALQSIAVTPSSASIAKGATQQYTATGTYSDSSTGNLTGTVTWASATPSVATIVSGGLATAVGAGTSNITASLSGVTSPAVVLTVTAPVLRSVAVTPASATISKGQTQQFTATGTYSDSSTANITGTVTWASSNTAAATIASNGLATGAGAGSSNITASLSGITSPGASLTVTSVTITSIAVSASSALLVQGSIEQFVATATYTDASTANISGQVTWVSSNPGAASISSSGLATAVSAGSTKISASLGAVASNSFSLTVTVPSLTSITVTAPNASLAKGATEQATATGAYSDGSSPDISAQVTWSSSNTAAATISSAGVVTAVAAGATNISASLNGVTSNNLALTVTAPTLTSIAITAPGASVAVGATDQFAATGKYSDNSTAVLTSQVTWSSSNTAIATVGANTGLATGVSAGTSNITATLGAVSSAPFLLTVSNPNSLTATSALAFSYTLGTPAPPAQGISVSSTTAGVSFTVTPGSNCGWLTVPASGITPATLSATVNTASFTASTSLSCTLTVSAPGLTSAQVQVSIVVIPGATLFVPSAPVSFVSVGGVAPASQNVNVTSSGPSNGVTFTITAGSNCGWLNIPTGGVTPATLTLSVNTAGLVPNTSYTCIATLASSQASNSPQLSANLTVTPNAVTVSQPSLTFSMPAVNSVPGAQNVQVSGPLAGTSFSASAITNSGGKWLSVTPTSGATPSTVTITADPTVVPAGANSYTGTVTIGQATVNVTMVLSLSTLNVGPSPLTFHAQALGSNPVAQILSVFTNSATPIAFTATTPVADTWLTAAISGSSVTVSANLAGLAANTYSSSVTINSPNTSPSQQVVPVTFTVDPPVQTQAAPSITPTPPSMTFAFVAGAAASSQSLQVANSGGGSLTFIASASSSWLTVSAPAGPVAGGAQSPLNVTADPTGLAANTYQGQVTLFNSVTDQTVTVPVTMTINQATLAMAVSVTALSFTAVQGSPNLPPADTIGVLNTGTGNLSFQTAPSVLSPGNGTWLTVTASGVATPSTPALIQVGVNPAGLQAGQYAGSILVTSPGAANAPQTISVALTVLQPGSALSPVVRPSGVILTGAPQTLTIYNLTSNAIGYTSATTASFFSQTPTNGSVTSTAAMTLQPGNLPTTAVSGLLRISFADGSLSTVTVLGISPGSLPSTEGTRPAASGAGGNQAGNCQALQIAFTDPVPNFSLPVATGTFINFTMTDGCGKALPTPFPNTVNVIVTSQGASTQAIAKRIDGTNFQSTWQPTITGVATSANATVVVTVGATLSNLDSGFSQIAGSIYVPSTPTPPVVVSTLTNGATNTSVSQAAPGSWVAIKGSNLADATSINPAPYSTSLAGAKVVIAGQSLPLYYASNGQINALLPYSLAPASNFELLVQHGTGQSTSQPVTVVNVQPGIFTVDSTGSGQGVIQVFGASGLLGLNGSDSQSVPAKFGDTLVIYCTGLGPTNPAVADGAPSPSPAAVTQGSVSVIIGGTQTKAAFAGLTAGFVGLYQVNVPLPAGLPSGDQPITLVVANPDGSNPLSSQSGVTVRIQ